MSEQAAFEPERRSGPSMTPRTLRRGEDLVAAGIVEAGDAAMVDAVGERYAVAVSREMAGAMVPGDRDDPIYRQFVPSAAELSALPEEDDDPIGDARFSPVKGIVHRHADRVLLKPLHVCPVYCRFCFRRETVGPGGEALSAEELRAALDYVREHTGVWEVILTGGDPLVMSPRRVGEIVRELDAVGHVETIRVHTRVPVVEPERVDAAMVAALSAATPVWVCLHVNHARELTAAARHACARLVDAGIPLLSQTVLLRGVNDDAVALEALFRALVRNRVKPYYLHHGDLARGTSHLRTRIDTGQRLVRTLRERASGICQPTYVLDLPGGYGKVPVGPGYLAAADGDPRRDGDGGERYRVEDLHGALHDYPPRRTGGG